MLKTPVSPPLTRRKKPSYHIKLNTAMKNTPAIPPLTEMKRPSQQSNYANSARTCPNTSPNGSFAASESSYSPCLLMTIFANSDFFAIDVSLWHAAAFTM
jgi:hypothetical protein